MAKKKKASKKAVGKSTKKTAKKPAKKAVKKTAKKSTKKATKKTAKKSKAGIGSRISDAYRAVVDSVKGTDDLRNKMEKTGTSETE